MDYLLFVTGQVVVLKPDRDFQGRYRIEYCYVGRNGMDYLLRVSGWKRAIPSR
jgi:hypothetical protein